LLDVLEIDAAAQLVWFSRTMLLALERILF